MDVRTYRAFKGMTDRQDNLRDQMTDLELALTTLAETAAAVLHRERDSRGVDGLRADVHDAGEIVSGTIRDFERRTGHGVPSITMPVAASGNQSPSAVPSIPSKVA